MDALKKEKKFITLLFLLSVGLFFWLVKSYIGVVIFAIITAFFSSGIYTKIYTKTKKVWLALTGAWTMIVLVVLLPLIFVMTTLVRQAGIFATDIGQAISYNPQEISQLQPLTDGKTIIDPTLDQKSIEQALLKIENFAKEKNINLNMQKIYTKGFEVVKNAVANITNRLYSLTLNMFSWFTALLLYIIVTTGILVHHNILLDTLKKVLPLDQRKTNLYLRKISAMLDAMVKGTFIIAIIQGIITGLSFLI